MSWGWDVSEIYHLTSHTCSRNVDVSNRICRPHALRGNLKQVNKLLKRLCHVTVYSKARKLHYSPVSTHRIYSAVRFKPSVIVHAQFLQCHRAKTRTRFARNLNSMTPSTSFPLFRPHHVDNPKQVHLGGQQTRVPKASGPTLVTTKPINAKSPLKDWQGKATAF